MNFTVFYRPLGDHVHASVFVNHAKAGELCMRQNEFVQFRARILGTSFIEQSGDAATEELKGVIDD